MPTGYASAPVLKIDWYMVTASPSCMWAARIGALTDADPETLAAWAADTAVAAAEATPVNGRLDQVSIDLSAEDDGLAAGDLVAIVLFRDVSGDTGATDAYFLGAVLEYTTT
jgi:hypothetical protein